MSKHLDIIWTNQFKKDYRQAMKRYLETDLLDDIIRKLAIGIIFPTQKMFWQNIQILVFQGISYSLFFSILTIICTTLSSVDTNKHQKI